VQSVKTGKIAIDSPISVFVGIRNGTAGDIASDSDMIKLLLRGTKTTLNVPEAFTIGELGESHAQKLIKTREGTHSPVATVEFHATIKFLFGKKSMICEINIVLDSFPCSPQVIF
jgi:hypothetical protein